MALGMDFSPPLFPGTASTSRSGSRPTSRLPSRPSSRPSSRPTSRVPSRPTSRPGSSLALRTGSSRPGSSLSTAHPRIYSTSSTRQSTRPSSRLSTLPPMSMSMSSRPSSSLSLLNKSHATRSRSGSHTHPSSLSPLSPLATPSRNASGTSLSRRPSSSLSVSSSGSTESVGSPHVYNGTIQVSVRPRPLPAGKPMWMVNDESSCIYNREAGDFFYDHVFVPGVDNHEVYAQTVQPIVSKCLQGYNGTVFAYGMTGSGKTYSMQGDESSPEGQVGIIELCVREIFDNFHRKQSHGAQTKVSCSYLEIYNEKLFDLLKPRQQTDNRQSSFTYLSRASSLGSAKDDLRIRDDPAYGVKVLGLTEVDSSDADSLMDIIRAGDTFRRTGGTDYNTRSSRSHAVVLIRLAVKMSPDTPESLSTLCLCDLAGSEKAASQIERRKEGSFINKSLLALGTVIAKLSQGSSSHIPYRDSKLTRLLQPSLSGNAVISILCTIHLSSQTFSETVNTLRFASRAKNVMYSVRRMEASDSAFGDKYVENLLRENEKLRKQVLDMKGAVKAERRAKSLSLGNGANALTGLASPLIPSLHSQLAELVSENKILTEQLEHQKRLNEESDMDSVVTNNDSLQQLLALQMEYDMQDPRMEEAIVGLENFGKTMMTKMEEMKSYVLHLESKLGQKEYHQALVDDAAAGIDSAVQSTKEDTLRDEIEQLQRSLQSRDAIIRALKSSRSVRDMFDNQEGASSPTSPMSPVNDENKPLALKSIGNIKTV